MEPDGWRVRVQFRVPLLGLVGEYEGDPTRRPLTYDEVRALFDLPLPGLRILARNHLSQKALGGSP